MTTIRRFLVCAFTAALAASAATASAQTQRAPVYKDVTSLGTGTTSFFPFPQRRVGQPGRLETLTDAASLRRMAEARGMQNDIRRILVQARVADANLVAADVLTTMRGGFSTQRKGGECTLEAPGEGELVECTFAAGGTLPWMAYRPDGRTPGIIRNFRWAGDAPFEAFIFRAYSRGRSYVILIPKPCGNLSITEPVDLRVNKVAQQGKVPFGAPVTFTITVSNSGPNGSRAADNVTLTDTLPDRGFAWALAPTSAQGCSLSGLNLSCSFGTLAAQVSKSVVVTGTPSTPFDACRELQNTARATATDAAPAQGSATSVCVPPVLRLAKRTEPFVIGSPAVFTMTVANEAPAGGSAASRVVLTDTLPTNGGLEWASATPSTCRLSGAGNATLQCDLGTLAATRNVVVTVTSRPAPVAACVAQANTATLNAQGLAPVQASATANCAPPQLSVKKSPDGDTFRQGGQASFTIVVSNDAPAGASPAANVRLSDTLPVNGGLTWDSVTTDAGTCELGGTRKSALSCSLGSIAPGKAVTVKVSSTAKTPRSACQAQPNLEAMATADGGFSAKDSGELTCDPSFNFFVDGFFGKDRRVRPIDGVSTLAGTPVVSNVGPRGGVDFAQCSPMFGFDIGMAKQLKNNWELAAKAGLAMSVVQADDKVREHQVLLDVEANKYLRRQGGAFIGGGLSMWDLFHSDTITPSALVHFGVPLGVHPSHPTHFVGEGRWLLREAGDIANNYQFWGGVRVKF